jgi:outer membrane protein
MGCAKASGNRISFSAEVFDPAPTGRYKTNSPPPAALRVQVPPDAPLLAGESSTPDKGGFNPQHVESKMNHFFKQEEVVNQKHQRIILGLVLSMGLAGAVGIRAQVKLAYINSQKVLESYQPYLDVQKKLEAENTQWGQELQKMSEQLKQLQEQLEQQSLLLSEAKKKEKAQEIQGLALKAQQYQQEKWGDQGEAIKRRNELMQPVFDQINVVINKLGQENGYDFVFDSIGANILYAPEKYNITEQVVARLAKENPAAAVKPAGSGK